MGLIGFLKGKITLQLVCVFVARESFAYVLSGGGDYLFAFSLGVIRIDTKQKQRKALSFPLQS